MSYQALKVLMLTKNLASRAVFLWLEIPPLEGSIQKAFLTLLAGQLNRTALR